MKNLEQKNNLGIKLISSVFLMGYLPIAPGTWGSFLTLLLVWFFVPDNFFVLLALFFVIFIISVWAATKAERIYGADGGQIVIDEACGMLVSLLWVPKELKLFVIAFVLFRLFDILKPPPAAKAEKLKAGWGVTTDDVVAGFYANLILHIFLWLRIF